MDKLLLVLKAVAEPSRLRILSALRLGEMTVSELTEILVQSQPRISRHLKLLCDCDLVSRNSEGTWVFYRLNEASAHHNLMMKAIESVDENDAIILQDNERLRLVKAAREKRASEYFQANAANWDAVRKCHIPDSQVESEMLGLLSQTKCELLVDLGTGTGRMLEVFADCCRKAIGFDLNHKMLTIARAKLAHEKKSHCQVRHGDCTSLPLKDGEADVALLHQVLHFLEYPDRALAEAARILTTNGHLLVADFLPHQLETLRTEHAHRRLGFSDLEIEEWFKKEGVVMKKKMHLIPPQSEYNLTVALWAGQKLAKEQV